MTKPTRILVVEDEFIIAHDIQTSLQGLGYDVPVVLSNAQEIVQKTQGIQPDLVLMDINLDGKIDGIEAAALLRTELNIPVLYLTSYTDEKTLERAKLTEPFGYIIKPFQQRELKTAIEMAVYKSRMDKKLRENEEWLSAILRSMNEAVVALNLSGEITFMNQVAESLVGVLQKDAIGKKLDKVFVFRHEASGAPIRDPLAEVVDLKSIVRVSNLVMMSKGGEEIPVEDTWAPIRDLKNEVSGVVLICKDVREMRKSESKRKDLEAQVLHVQKLESIGILAGGIAHDFNNLLCIILGNANLALANVKDSELVREKVKLVELTALRASELVKQILSYSGKAHSVLELANLSHVVGEMGTLLQTSISKKVDLDFSFGDGVPPFLADIAQIRQVIMNLIINASDAIGEARGQIRVQTGVMEAQRDYLSQALMGHDLAPGRYIYLQVSDTGSGMDAATKAKIFDPFFTTKVTGRGLGLAVVLGIVRTHGGGIVVDSKQGEGTTFRVLFPVQESKATATKSSEATVTEAPKVSKGGGTILVVDDEGNILTIVKEILEQEGFNVLTAETGTKGLDLFKQKGQEIDAVLLDMTMPDMDGTEALVRMRSLRPDVKVVLTSGYHEDDIISRLTAHGIKHFIQKPYLPNTLVDKVYEVLESNP